MVIRDKIKTTLPKVKAPPKPYVDASMQARSLIPMPYMNSAAQGYNSAAAIAAAARAAAAAKLSAYNATGGSRPYETYTVGQYAATQNAVDIYRKSEGQKALDAAMAAKYPGGPLSQATQQYFGIEVRDGKLVQSTPKPYDTPGSEYDAAKAITAQRMASYQAGNKPYVDAANQPSLHVEVPKPYLDYADIYADPHVRVDKPYDTALPWEYDAAKAMHAAYDAAQPEPPGLPDGGGNYSYYGGGGGGGYDYGGASQAIGLYNWRIGL
jgi:hypothetical protein